MSTKGSWSRVHNHDQFRQNHDDIFKIKREIMREMQTLKDWAKAYEEGQPVEDDSVYDMQVRLLQKYEEEHPNDFAAAMRTHPEFVDGSWKYTGGFIYSTQDD